MDSATLFIDTNGFIQLRDLKDLKWRKLFPRVKRVRIMVARAVIDELDRLKTSTKDRQRNRARAALKLIGEASKAKSRVLTINDKPVLVTLEISPRAKLDWEWLSFLDPHSADDRLVAEAVTYGNDAAIFSHDSGPRISAEDLGLKAYEPLEDWHLDPELSDADKRIASLERRLKVAESSKPKLEIEIEGRDSSGKVTIYRPIVRPLDEEAVDQLVKRYLEEHPRASPVAPYSDFYALTSPFEITRGDVSQYHNEYDAFEARLRDFFEKLHELVPFCLAVPVVRIKTVNTGNVSAIHFHVTLKTSADFSLVASAAKIRKMCPFPKAPKEPKGRGFIHPALHGPFGLPQEPHPTKIVWIDKPELGDSIGKYGCKDFQPQRVHERDVALWRAESLPATGTLSITAGANDIPDTTQTVEVRLEEREETWDSPSVVESLPDFLQPVLCAHSVEDVKYEHPKTKAKQRVSTVTKARSSKP